MRTADIAERAKSFFKTDHHGAVAVYLFGSWERKEECVCFCDGGGVNACVLGIAECEPGVADAFVVINCKRAHHHADA